MSDEDNGLEGRVVLISGVLFRGNVAGAGAGDRIW